MANNPVSGQADDLIDLEVSLPSGRCETVKVLRSGTVADLKIAAQQLRKGFLKLAAPDGHLFDLTEALQFSGFQGGESIAAVAQQPKLAATDGAFALWCVGGDRVVTWGSRNAVRWRRQLQSARSARQCSEALLLTRCFCCNLGRWNGGDMGQSRLWW